VLSAVRRADSSAKFACALEQAGTGHHEAQSRELVKLRKKRPRSLVAQRLCNVNGRSMAEDELRSGRPACVRTSTNIDHVRAFIRQDRLLTIRMIADELNAN
jgi:hypothetical protein